MKMNRIINDRGPQHDGCGGLIHETTEQQPDGRTITRIVYDDGSQTYDGQHIAPNQPTPDTVEYQRKAYGG